MYLPIYTKPLWWYKYPEIINKDEIVTNILLCKNEDGGFGNYPKNTSYLETIFYAIVALSLLNETDKLENNTIEYVLSSQSDDGGFGEYKSNSSNLFNTFYAVTILKIFDKITPRIRNKVMKYLKKSIIHGDGIYEQRVGLTNTTSLFWTNAIIKSISLYDPKINSQMVDFCLSCYDKENTGLFAAIPNGLPTIQNTYECLAILKECSSLELIDSERIYKSILERKHQQFFKDDLLGYPTYSTCMWAMLSLNIIGKLNQLQHSDVLALSISAINQGNSLFDLFCSVNIIANMLFETGKIHTDKTLVISAKGETKSLEIVENAIQVMVKNGIDYIDFDFINILSLSKAVEVNENNTFVQILVNQNYNRMFEVEVSFNNSSLLCLVVPISRVTSECVTYRTISSSKIKLFGVFDSDNSLSYARQEKTIIDDYCQNNNLFKYTSLIGNSATFINVKQSIKQGCNILYYSGHSKDGTLRFADTECRISDFFDLLIENHCTIAVLNCCNTYQFVADYFETHKFLNESLNIICTLKDVSDEQAKLFATMLFRYLEIGYPISEALRISRVEIYNMYNGCGNTWWSYVLFGNPFTVLESPKQNKQLKSL